MMLTIVAAVQKVLHALEGWSRTDEPVADAPQQTTTTLAEDEAEEVDTEVPPPPPGAGRKVLVVVVAGGSGSGKSVFCKRLAAMLEVKCKVVVLPHDSYYRNQEEVDRDCAGNWDCPQALHTDELLAHIETLRAGAGGGVMLPYFDFTSCKRDSARSTPVSLEVDDGGVVLVEGLMALHDPRLRAVADLSVYIDCDEDIRFMRRLARDTGVGPGGRGRSATSVYRAWADTVKPAHHRFVEPTKRYADVAVPSTAVHVVPRHLRVVEDDPALQTATGRGLRALSVDGEGSLNTGTDLEMWPALHLLHAFITATHGHA